MKINRIVLSMVLLVGCTVSYAAEKQQIKEADSTFNQFKKDIQCKFKGTCTPEQNARLRRQGTKLLKVVVPVGLTVGAGVGLHRWLYHMTPEKAKEHYLSLKSGEASTLVNRDQKEEEVWEYIPRFRDPPSQISEPLESYLSLLIDAEIDFKNKQYKDAYQKLLKADRMLDDAYAWMKSFRD